MLPTKIILIINQHIIMISGDHVTLKTAVINDVLKYIKIEIIMS